MSGFNEVLNINSHDIGNRLVFITEGLKTIWDILVIIGILVCFSFICILIRTIRCCLDSLGFATRLTFTSVTQFPFSEGS